MNLLLAAALAATASDSLARNCERHPPISLRGYFPVPLRTDDTGKSWLTGRVKDLSIEFLLDTGANTSIIDDKTAAALGLKVTPRDGTVSGVLIPLQKPKSADLDGLVVGKYHMDVVTVDVLDMTPIAKAGKWGNAKHYGIFGNNLLTYFDAIIDHRRRIVYLRDEPRYEVLLWQGEWTLTGLVHRGKVINDPKMLDQFRLVVADRLFTLTQKDMAQTGRLSIDPDQKVYGLTEMRKNGVLVYPDRQPPKPGSYESGGSYEVDERTLRFSVPTVALTGAEGFPKKLESTAENKLAVFTWKRATARPPAPPVKPAPAGPPVPPAKP